MTKRFPENVNGAERRFVGGQGYGSRATDVTPPRLELRGDQRQPVAVGYAAVFYRADDPGTQFWLLSDLVERIAPQAFTAALAQGDDVRGLTNHDVGWLLGRAGNKTLRLAVDEVGLRYEIDLPDTQAGRDTRAMLERGDMDGSSFSFTLRGKRGKVTWSQETKDGVTVDVRTVEDLELWDVGPVVFPAYESTSAGVRSASGADLVDVLEERDRWRASLAAGEGPDVELELRLAELRLE